MDAYPAVIAGRRADDGHLRVPIVPGDEPPQGRCGVVAQHRLLATCLDRREEAAFEGWIGMTHRIDTAMQQVKMATANPHGDCVMRQAAAAQLVNRKNSPSLSGQTSNLRVGAVRPSFVVG
jgi:hypothetical protein